MSSVKIHNNKIENVGNLSQLDFGGVLKDVHSFPGHYLRTRDALTLVKSHYDYLTATYNGNLPTQVKYYVGLKSQVTKIQTIADNANSLNNKYFYIYEGRSSRRFYVWFNVNGLGIDPQIADATAIQINIDTNDSSEVVALAIKLTLNSNDFKEYFTTTISGSIVEITANKTGETTDSIDVNTGFTISNSPGESSLIQTVDIKYSGANPLFEGQVLKNYYFDVFKGCFEKNQTADTVVTWDAINTTFPSDTSELYSYTLNNVLVQTILVHYQNSTKKIIVNIEKTRF